MRVQHLDRSGDGPLYALDNGAFPRERRTGAIMHLVRQGKINTATREFTGPQSGARARHSRYSRDAAA